MTPAIGFAGVSTATTDPLPDGPVVLAVDIGGTKMAAAVVDDAGTLLSRARTPTPHDLSAEVVFEAPGPDAEIVAKLRAVFATYEFESEVRVQAR